MAITPKQRNPQDATVKHYITPLRRDVTALRRRVAALERAVKQLQAKR